ncbi:MFS transporter [Kutzneria buriramensis]|uniref:MFS transporter n=1 Tax=Kutzneria buriramensis TaxID=1045776 RepID=A0A3E0GYJ1_9PSEU|nr:MFS transporter [Kutzneria buriramensis]REH35180.1 MFS transporter [Kutzneria buriramensis]
MTLLARHQDFRRLFVGNSVSLLGSSVTTVALPLVAVVYLRATPVDMGLLGAAAFLPHLVLGLPAGVWVDRLPYKRILVIADLCQLVLIGSVPIAAALGLLTLEQLYAVVSLAGVCSLFDAIAAQSFTPQLVPRDQLLPANSALMLTTSTVGVTGSAIASGLVALLAAPLAMAVDAVSFLIAALFKSRITAAGVGNPLRGKGDLFDGLREMFSHPVLRPVTIAAALGALGGQTQNAVLVLYLVRVLGFSPAFVGIALTVAGIAGILAALITPVVTRHLGPGRTFVFGMLLSSAAGLLLATGPAVLSQLLRGAGPALYGVNQQTFRQKLVQPALLSRVNAAWRFLVYGTQPVGAVLGGLLGTVDLRLPLIVSGVLMLAGTALALPLTTR